MKPIDGDRWLKILLIGLFFLVLMSIGFLLEKKYLSTKEKTTIINRNKTEIKKINYDLTDYSDVVKKNLSWLRQQKNEDGGYFLEIECNPNENTCEKNWNLSNGNRDILLVTYARFKYFESNKNVDELTDIQKDIDYYISKYPDGVDDGLWICKIAYEMTDSKLLGQETNTKLNRICFNNKYLGLDEVKNFWSNLNKNANVVASSINDRFSDWEDYSLSGRGFDAFFGYTSEYLDRFYWNKNSADLDLAKQYLEEYRNQIKNQLVVNQNDVCLIGLSALDMYRYDKNDDNLTFAKDLYNGYFISEEKEESSRTPLCGFFVKELLRETDDELYFKKIESMNKLFITIFLDSEINSINKDGGFFKANYGTLSLPIKNVTENGLIDYLLMK